MFLASIALVQPVLAEETAPSGCTPPPIAPVFLHQAPPQPPAPTVVMGWAIAPGRVEPRDLADLDGLPTSPGQQMHTIANLRRGPDGSAWMSGGSAGLVIDGTVMPEDVRDSVLLGARTLPPVPSGTPMWSLR